MANAPSNPPEFVPEYLCIGHICRDLKNGKYLLGGSSAYSGKSARLLGKRTAILTSLGKDFEFYHQLEGISIEVVPSSETTLFENIYSQNKRTQFIHAVAGEIKNEHIPPSWKNAGIVHICPVANEVEFDLMTAFDDALICVTPQGWMRSWDLDKKIVASAMDWEQLGKAEIAILSDADIAGFEEALPSIVSSVEVTVLTHGKNGATIFSDGKKWHFPSYPVREVDPTGAGDVFTAAFLVEYATSKDVALATGFGHAAASLSVEKPGLEGILSKDEIEERFDHYKRLFF